MVSSAGRTRSVPTAARAAADRRRRWAPTSIVAALLLTAAVAQAPAAGAVDDEPVAVNGITWSVRGDGTFLYGSRTDVQLMGDWDGNGTTTPGVFRSGRWYLRNSRTSGVADLVVGYGDPGDVPVVGDWDGDGRTGIGVVRGNRWYLRNTLTTGVAEVSLAYGNPGDLPVTGDWDGDRRAGIGVVRAGTWYLRNALSSGVAQLSFRYGDPGDVAVAGDWDANGRTGIGIVRGATWYLRESLSSGVAEQVLTHGACGQGVLSTSGARPVAPVPISLRGTEWSVLPTTSKVVALTFDAGANADGVASILATLRAQGVPATFFLTGDWAYRFPNEARAVAATHPVGNHTVSHPDLTTLSDAAVRAQVLGADVTIRAVTGQDTRPWFRFPYGARDARTIGLVNCASYGSVRWTVDTLGWQGTSGGQSVATVVQRVLSTLRPGQIVLMHVGSNPTDGSTLDAAALPTVITELRARGYGFVTLDAFLGS
jgi:peptidoglycan/xylan/chitin deacetylase (PgdA/CDA1 family)